MQIKDSPSVEAREWLLNATSCSAFATNRFGNTERASEFVESLYSLGATLVLVDHPCVDSNGDPYGDTLLVSLPEDLHASWSIQEFCENEGPTEVPGDFTMHLRDRELRLWWD